MVTVGRQSAQRVVEPALVFQEIAQGQNGEWVPQSRVVEPAINEDSLEQ